MDLKMPFEIPPLTGSIDLDPESTYPPAPFDLCLDQLPEPYALSMGPYLATGLIDYARICGRVWIEWEQLEHALRDVGHSSLDPDDSAYIEPALLITSRHREMRPL